MCEILAVAWPSPQPISRVLPWAREIERFGVAGFGWGVAWLDVDGGVVGYRSDRSLAGDKDAERVVEGTASARVLLHLRRPSRLSTVGVADSQPFVHAGGAFAYCHNGQFAHAERHRRRLGGQLAGRADSEVGFTLLTERLERGELPDRALRDTHDELGGLINAGFLGADGSIHMQAAFPWNPIWSFHLGTAAIAATSLHSDDDSIFDLIFARSVRRRRVGHGVREVALPLARDGSAG